MKTPKKAIQQIHKPPNEDFISPSLQDIIKYEQLGKKLQADAFHSTVQAIKTWLIRLISPK